MIEKLIKLAEINHQKDVKRGTIRYLDNNSLLNAISSEVEEVREEIKEQNSPKLEDELCDILWGWMMLVENLKTSNLVGSHEDIIDRAIKKYSERILPLVGEKDIDEKIWQEVKNSQKKALQEEEELLYKK